jgi:hypothetical protein
LLSCALGAARVWCSDRHGGVSRPPFDAANVGDHVGDDPEAVAENRRRLARRAGLPAPERWVWLRQVHGASVVTAARAPAAPPQADAAVTAARRLPLTVVTADCAPVALACDDAVGVAHAGHRGLLLGVVEATVARLRAIGNGPVRALVGPCIRPGRYAFGADDLAPLVAAFGPDVAARTADGRPALDVPAAVRIALRRAGVVDVEDTGVCTFDSADHFSYRRDATTGRQATVVVLP